MLIFDSIQIKENSNNVDDLPSENSNNTDDKTSELSVASQHISQEGTESKGNRRSSKILQANEILPKHKDDKHSTYYTSDIQLEDDGETVNISDNSDSSESEDTPTPDFPFIVLCFDNDKYMKVIHTHEDDGPKQSVEARSSKMHYAKSNMKLLIIDDNDLNTDRDIEGKSSIISLPDMQDDKVALGNALSLLKKFKTESPDNKDDNIFHTIDMSKYEPTKIEGVHSPQFSDSSFIYLEHDEHHKKLDSVKAYDNESHVKIVTDVSFNTNIQYEDALDGIQVNKEVSVTLQDKSKLSGSIYSSGLKTSSPEIKYKLDEKRVSIFSLLKGSQINGQSTKDSNAAVTFDYNVEARKSLCQLNDSEFNPLLNSVIAYGRISGNNTPSFVTEIENPLKTSESLTNGEHMEYEYVKMEHSQKEGRVTFGKKMNEEPEVGMQLTVDISSAPDISFKQNINAGTDQKLNKNQDSNLKDNATERADKENYTEELLTTSFHSKTESDGLIEHSEDIEPKRDSNDKLDNVEPVSENNPIYNEEEIDKDFQPLNEFEEVVEDDAKELHSSLQLDENVNEIELENENIANENPALTSVHSNKELEDIEPVDSDQMESKDISKQDSVKIDKDSEDVKEISDLMETDVKVLTEASPTNKDPMEDSLGNDVEPEVIEIEKINNDEGKVTNKQESESQNDEDKNDKDSEHLKDISEVMEADVQELNLTSQDKVEVFMESKLDPDTIESKVFDQSEKELKIERNEENVPKIERNEHEGISKQKSIFEESHATDSIDADEAIRNKHKNQVSIEDSINDTKTISEISATQKTSVTIKDLTSFIADGEFGTNDAPIRKGVSSDSDNNKNEVVSPIRKKSSGGETNNKMKHESSEKLSQSKPKVKSKVPSFTAVPIKRESKKSTSKTASKVKRKSLTKINEEKKFKETSRALIFGIRKDAKKVKTEEKLIELKRENRIKLKSTDFYPSINYSPCQNPARALPSMSNRENTMHFQKILQTDDIVVLKRNTVVNLNDIVDAMAVTVTLKTFGIVNLSDNLLLEEAIGIIRSKCAILKGMINRKYPIFKEDIYQFINTKCMAHPIQPPIYSIPSVMNNQQSPEKLSNHNKEDPGNGSVRTYAYFVSLNKTFAYYTQQQNYIAQEFCDNPHHRYLNGNYLHNTKYLHENATINNRYMNTVKINLDSLKKLFR